MAIIDKIITQPIMAFCRKDATVKLYNILSILHKANNKDRENILNMLFSDVTIVISLNNKEGK